MYLKSKKIKNPVVLESGIDDSCHEFYEQILGAEIVTPETLSKKKVDILSIGGGLYHDVQENFNAFFSHCKGIVAIHDIESCRYKKRETAEAWRFWDELKIATACGAEEFENFLFITLHQKRERGNQRGIGVMVKQ